MQSRKYQLAKVLLVSACVLLSLLAPSFTPPALARDRVFLDLSLDFLGEYKLPKTDFLNTPVEGISAITYNRRRDRFIAVSDNSSASAPARFYTLKIALDSTTEGTGIEKVEVESVTFLADKEAITPKGIALTPQQTIFISGYSNTNDQIAPFVREFDQNGKMLQSLTIPERYLPDTIDKKEQTKGIRDRLAFESLTFNPTGTIPTTGEPINLFTATSSAIVQDWEPDSSEQKVKSRLLHYLIGYGSPSLIAEYFYPLEPTALNNLVEILSIDRGGHFLSLERSRDRLGNEKIFQVTTGGATDTSRINSLKGEIRGVRPIKKKLLLDLNDLGIPLDDLQAMSLGPRLKDGTQSLLLVSHNDVNNQQMTQFLLFRLASQS